MKHIELNNQVMTLKPNGFFDLDKDKQAIQAFIEEEVQPKLRRFRSREARMNYLVNNDYYYKDLFNQYSMQDILEIEQLVYSQGFEFQSYMAISKFYKDYALKSNDKKNYLETYEDHVVIVSLYLSEGDMNKARKLADALVKQCYQPATPTFLNAGRSRRGELISCFLLGADDSINSIFQTVNTSAQLSKVGGGVAINLSALRGRGETIKEIENAASGVVPVMKILEDTFNYANQLGQRAGAGAVYLNIFHWDVEEFLATKRISGDEKSRMQTLSIGLIAETKFFDLAEAGEDLYVFAPYTVYKEYGIHLDDMNMNDMYDKLMENPNVKKKLVMPAREMLNRIAITQLESGYPYIMYKSNANAQHPLKNIGQVKMSNLCTEIFQLQERSTITDYGQEDVIKRDINCNLGSLNITNVMEQKNPRDTIHVAVEALTTVSDMSDVQNAPTVKKANEELHSIGLGAMNLHGYLAKNRIMYESMEAVEFTSVFFMIMNYYSLEKSMMIARERGQTFKDFDKSDYASGVYFDQYLAESFEPQLEKVQALFEGIHVPTPADWARLKEDVMTYGVYSAYRMATAPTQSIGYIQNATPSIMPLVSQIETRTYGNATTYYPMPYLNESNLWFYKSAFDMNQFRVMDLIAAAQKHVDQGISATLFVTSDISTRELARYYVYASKIGLKSLYYTRTRNDSANECLSCSV